MSHEALRHRKEKAAAAKGSVPAERKPAAPSPGEREKKLSAFYATGPARPLAAPGPKKQVGVSQPAAQMKPAAVGKVGDRWEREADHTADKVTRGERAPEVSRMPSGALGAQSKEHGADCPHCRAQRQAEEGEVQEAGGEASTARAETPPQPAAPTPKAQAKADEEAQEQEDTQGPEQEAQAQEQEEGGGEEAQEQEEGASGEEAQEVQAEVEEGGEAAQEAPAAAGAAPENEPVQAKDEEGEAQNQEEAQAQEEEGGEEAQEQAGEEAQQQEEEGSGGAAQEVQAKEEEGGEEAQEQEAEPVQEQEDEGGGEEAQEVQAEVEEGGEAAQEASAGPVRRREKGMIAARAIRERGAGEPLAPAVRTSLERGLGNDLSDVRVHRGGAAGSAAREMRARAFTHKNHVWLAPGESPSNLKLMAHEVTHTLQQGGVVRRKPAADEGGPRPARREGEATRGSSSRAVSSADSAPKARELSAADTAPKARETGPAGASPKARERSGDRPPAAERPPTARPTAADVKGAPEKKALPDVASDDDASAAGARTRLAPPPPPAPSAPASPGAQAPPAPSGGGPKAAVPPPAAPASSPAPRAEATRAPEGSAGPTAGKAAPVPVLRASDGSGFTGEPSESLGALAALSPARAPFAYRAFREGVGGALERRRKSEHRDRPHAGYRLRSPRLPTGRPALAGRPGAAVTPAEAGLATEEAPAEVPVSPAETGPAPAVDTAAREREIESVDEKEPSAIQRLRAWLADFFARLPTSDEHVNTDPGPVRRLTLTGESSPARIDSITAERSAKMARGLDTADGARDEDFGEYDVEPEMADGEAEVPVPAHVHNAGTGCDPEADAERLAFDPPHEAELAVRVNAETGARFASERDRLQAAERQRDTTIAEERGRLPGLVAGAHASAYRREEEAAAAARARVDDLREGWGGENRAVQAEYERLATGEGRNLRSGIKEHVGLEQGAIDERHRTTRDEAETRKKTVEADARREREAAQRASQSESSGSWFSRGVRWVKNKVRSALAWAAKKIKGWFDDLRAWVREKFAEFKRWVNEKIENARRWVIGKLEDLRNGLNALVDKHLGRFPGVAARFKRVINSTIDSAQAGVDAAADGLKKTVNRAIDSLAAAVDKTLAVTEKVVVGGLTVACDLVVTGLNLLVVFVDQDLEAMIELVRELPDWPPLGGGLMGMVRAGLLGFLEQVKAKPADEKKRYVEKTRGLITSPSYYGGVFLGILKGIVWDGLVGTVRMIYDIVKSVPQILSDIYDAIKRLATDTEAIDAIVEGIEATRAELDAFLKRPDAADQVVAYLKRAPQVLVAMVDHALHEGREWAYRAGAGAADKLFAWILRASNFDIGMAVGTFVGQIIFEVVLLVFTAGAGTAVKVGGKVLQWLLKGLRALTRGLRTGGGLIMKALRALRSIAHAGLAAARRLGGALKKVFARVGELVDRVLDWFRRAFGRIGRGAKKRFARTAKERRQWAQFRRQLRIALAGHPDGISKARLRALYRDLVKRYRRVVRRPTYIRKDGPHWQLWARPVKGLPRPVGKVLLDHATRWKQGRKAVEAAIRGLKRRPGNIDAAMIDAALVRVKREFHYTALVTTFVPARNTFVVDGAMSRKRRVAKATPKRPTANVVASVSASESVRVNPLVKRTAFRSSPTGTPPHWAEVEKIKTRSGKTSLYRKGHLVSGYFLGGDAWNLTPITFSANAMMAARTETPIKRTLPMLARASSSKPVYDFEVKASGQAGGTPPRRSFVEGGKRVCEVVPEEKKLYRTITTLIRAFGYDDKSHKWDRSVPLPKGARPGAVPNVPPFPAGEKCPRSARRK